MSSDQTLGVPGNADRLVGFMYFPMRKDFRQKYLAARSGAICSAWPITDSATGKSSSNRRISRTCRKNGRRDGEVLKFWSSKVLEF